MLEEFYPSRAYPITLRGVKGPGSLSRLKRLNPHWPFRDGFDPESWQILFLHGYIDNTGSDRAIHHLPRLGYTVHMIRYPFLRTVEGIAEEVYEILRGIRRKEGDRPYVLLGHSLGGLIWDHLLKTEPTLVKEYQIPLYIPMGSPHYGTLPAFLAVGGSGRDMRPGSPLLRRHLAMDFPLDLEIYPFVSRFDLLVLPVETALLPTGVNYIFSETGHLGLVVHSHLLYALEEVFATDPRVLRERVVYRPFFPDSLTEILKRLPEGFRKRVGLEKFFMSLGADGAPHPLYHLRIVPRNWVREGYPVLRRLA
jgi:pimeloyl-ACP methyl ester carboxylesterase